MTGKDITKVTINLVIIYIVGGLLIAGIYSITSPIVFILLKEEKEAALQRMMPIHLKVASAGVEAKVQEVLSAQEPKIEAVEVEGGLDAEVDLYDDQLEKLIKKLKKTGAAGVEEYSDFTPVKTGDWEPWHKHAEYFIVNSTEGTAGYIVETYGKGYSSYVHVLVAVDKGFTVKKINVIGHGETPGLGDEIEVAEFLDQYRGKDAEHLVVIKGETEDKIQAITGATISTRAVTSGVRDGVEMLMKKYGAEGGEVVEEKEGAH